MKKFISNLLAFTAFTLFFYFIGVMLWGQFMPSIFKPNINYRIGSSGHMYTRLKEITQIKDVDILFLGSSHSYRGFDTRIFKNRGFNTFNLGSSAQTPIQTLILLHRYLDKLNPRLVIFEVNPMVFSSDGVESSLDLIANGKNDFYSYQMALKINNIKTYNTLLYSIPRDILNLNKSYNEPVKNFKEIYIEGGYVESEIVYYKPGYISKSEIVFHKNQLEAFEQCLSEIKKRKIELILVYAPITHCLYSSYTNVRYFNKKMTDYGDYYNFNERINLSDSLHFSDDHHLNQNGVKLFDEKFIDILKLNEKRKTWVCRNTR